MEAISKSEYLAHLSTFSEEDTLQQIMTYIHDYVYTVWEHN